MDVPAKTNEEINQIALDLYKNEIFTDRHLPNGVDLPMVFRVFMFLNTDQIREMGNSDIGMVYEYLHKAGPMRVNGLPTFFSVQYLNGSDAKKVMEKFKWIKERVDFHWFPKE